MAYEASKYPTSAVSSAVAGKKFLLYVAYDSKWNLVGGLRDTGLTISQEGIDASSKDNDGWGESIAGARNWEASAEIVVKSTNEGDAIVENWVLDDVLQDTIPALKFAFVNAIDKTYYHGFGVVTSYELSASYDDVMTKSISISGSSKITKATAFSDDTLA